MKTTCPTPGCAGTQAHEGICPACGRGVKQCACGTLNHVFANFCRHCGKPFLSSPRDWLELCGPGHCGYSPSLSGRRILDLDPCVFQELGAVRMEGPCSALFWCDGYLLAVWSLQDRSGVVISRLGRQGLQTVGSVSLPGSVNAAPIIHLGSLYIASGSMLRAFSLAALAQGEQAPRWVLPFFNQGVPVIAMLGVGDSLYVTLAYAGNTSNLVRVDGIGAGKQPRVVGLYGGNAMPTTPVLHGTGAAASVYCVAPDAQGKPWLGCASCSNLVAPMQWHPIQGAQVLLEPYHPVVCSNGNLYAITREKQSLCRIDLLHPMIETDLAEGTRGFAVSPRGQVVVLSSLSLKIPHLGQEEKLSPGEIFHGIPLWLGDFAIAAGMGEGVIRFFDAINISRSREWRFSGAHSRVLAMAPSGELLAAGDSEGLVKVARFVFTGSAGETVGPGDVTGSGL